MSGYAGTGDVEFGAQLGSTTPSIHISPIWGGVDEISPYICTSRARVD